MAKRLVRAVLAVLMVAGAALTTELSKDTQFSGRDLPCPNEGEILPCTCSTDELIRMHLDCSLVKNSTDLERAMNATFPYKDFFELIIIQNPADENYQLTEIHSDTFHFLTFEHVTITGTKIKVLEQNVFTYSYNSLTNLNLENNLIEEFPFETMLSYKVLKILVLDNNRLRTLEIFGSSSLETFSIGKNTNLLFTYDVLYNLPNLVTLNMEGIALKEIPQHFFRNLSRIYYINFNDNDLVELNEYTIDIEFNTLGYALFANNRISNVKHRAIDGMLSNGIIDLSKNKITEVPQYIWQPILDQIPQGKLDLTDNTLRCGCDMSWLYLNTTSIYPIEVYLPIFTDTTTCYDGTQVSFLDWHVFQKHCAQ